MTMSPLHPCGKTWSRGTHDETVKNLALFSSMPDHRTHNHESNKKIHQTQ